MRPRKVHAQGNVEPLFVASYTASCGDIDEGEGVAFMFGLRGFSWVVSLADLRAIVAEAEEAQRVMREMLAKGGES